MSARTFYLAANSVRSIEGTKRSMADLEARGMVSLMDWTACLSAPESEWPELARRDVEAAVNADVFAVFTYPASYGAMLELGARLGAGKPAHVLGPPGGHFFISHPLVRHHADWSSFLASLGGGQ